MITKPQFPHVVDSTMISALRECPQKMFRAYMQHWKPQLESVDLVAGGAFAKGAEVARKCFYEEGMDEDTSLGYGLSALTKYYGNFDPVIDTPKTLENMQRAFEYFFYRYPLGSDMFEPLRLGSKLGIEFSFLEPLGINHPVTGDPILLSGRADMLGTYCDQIMLEDDKTTKQLGTSWAEQWEMRSQFSAYAWAVQKALDIKVSTYLVRGLAIKKTGDDCMQVITHRSEYMVNAWYSQTIRDLNRLINMWDEGYYDYNFDNACNSYFKPCHFTEVCKTGEDEWLPATMIQRVWDPISREEVSLEEFYRRFEGNIV